MGLQLLSLAGGVGLIIVLDLILFRCTSLSVGQAALVSVLAVLGIYIPWALVDWPGSDVVTMHLAAYLLAALGCGLLPGVRAKTPGRRGRAPGFHWGPAAIIGFFALLFITDFIFIMLAERGLSPELSKVLLPETYREVEVSSAFPGIVSHDFQEKEALYNDYLKQLERQRARGWRIRKGWLQRPVLGEPAVFRVAASTREGEPLSQADVTGRFLRPSDSRLDILFTLQEVEPGVYQTVLNLPAPGRWDLVLQVRKGDELHEVRARTRVQTSAAS